MVAQHHVFMSRSCQKLQECTLIRDQEILLAIVCFQLLQIVFSEATMVRSQHFAVS